MLSGFGDIDLLSCSSVLRSLDSDLSELKYSVEVHVQDTNNTQNTILNKFENLICLGIIVNLKYLT